ncbi:MAG: hypothetical protein ACTSUN_01785, partial [Promethearchaeota archaeon]
DSLFYIFRTPDLGLSSPERYLSFLCPLGCLIRPALIGQADTPVNHFREETLLAELMDHSSFLRTSMIVSINIMLYI